MRFNKQIAVILVLSSLLLSAIGAAWFLFNENENTKKVNAFQVTVYIAKQDIKKDTLIKNEDIVKMEIAKKYLLEKPLLINEVVNKFAKETIYKNEMFRKEKLALKLGVSESQMMPSKHNSYNAAYSLFQNPNYSLQKGNIINIVSVYPKSKSRDNMNYTVGYVAKQINVLGFLEKGKVVETAFRKIKQEVKQKGKNNKDTKYEVIKVFANEVVLDISDEVILSMLSDYNKGKQLWMVKTNKSVPKVKEKKIEPMFIIVDNNTSTKKIVKMAKKAKKRKRKRVYPYKMYIPKNRVETKTAVIEFSDTSLSKVSQKATIKTDLEGQCKSQKRLLIGISKKIHLRSYPSLNGKIKKIVYRNYMLPYKSKINKNWYEICDGKFVHKNEATIIDYKKAQGLLSGIKTNKK